MILCDNPTIGNIIPRLAIYTTYILPSGGLYATYHLLGEPETTIEPLASAGMTGFPTIWANNIRIHGAPTIAKAIFEFR